MKKSHMSDNERCFVNKKAKRKNRRKEYNLFNRKAFRS